jgi:hypothetical protein
MPTGLGRKRDFCLLFDRPGEFLGTKSYGIFPRIKDLPVPACGLKIAAGSLEPV